MKEEEVEDEVEDGIELDLNESVNTEEETDKFKTREYINTLKVNDERIIKKGNTYQTGNNNFEVDILHPNKPLVEWIKGFKGKYNNIVDETELKDGKNLPIITFHRIHPETKERFTTQYINSYAAITWTTSKLDQFLADEQRFHHPTKPVIITNKQLLNIFKQPYALDIAEILINKNLITVKEFAEKVNISEQMARIRLRKFEELKLLVSFRYSRGGTKHYKSVLKKEKLREIMGVFLE